MKMWVVLDRPHEKYDWAYFAIYPTEKAADHDAEVIRQNREATVVPVEIPVPDRGQSLEP